jgi:transcription termination factor NusB
MTDIQEIINALADEADELLDGVSTKQDARPVIREYLEKNHPELDKTERAIVLAGLFEILEEEEFFEAPTGTDLRYDGSEDAV